MSKIKTYSEKLRDPRWQKKRLEILQTANFACQECGSQKKTLHVHHRFYEKGKAPWEYDNLNLQCLCKDCHSEKEKLLKNLYQEIGYFNNEDLKGILENVFSLWHVGPWSVKNFYNFFKDIRKDFNYEE